MRECTHLPCPWPALTALAAYVASLDAGKSRFDRYYFDQDTQALTTQEAWGLRLFIRKGRCANCHLVDSRGAPFTDNAFHRTGIGRLEGSYKDRGRAAITGDPADEGAFKTPGLRGVALRPCLMHDGSVSSLREAVEHYNERINEGSPNLDERLAPLHLTSDEVDAIVAFLGTSIPENAAGALNSAAVR
jgi:cytochrome c peroxidase